MAVQPASEAQVRHFCGDCHAFPKPESFPRTHWRKEVLQGFQFYMESQRHDLQRPDVEAVVAYYEQHAPRDMWVDLPNPEKRSPGPIAFREQVFHHGDARLPAVSHIVCRALDDGKTTEILTTDMRASLVTAAHVRGRELSLVDGAYVPHPAHVERCDLDADGRFDWLISDLGSFDPADHQRGNLVSVPAADSISHGSSDGSSAAQTPQFLLKGTGRIADARAADLDGDGDQDVVAAIFGWRKSGRLVWLEHQAAGAGPPEYQVHELDARHGCSHVPTVDIDHDGDVDIVALFSQEYESVELFLNDGQGQFEKKTLFEANDPSYGSSSIYLADLDGDDDHDVIYTHGDVLDSELIRPFHGVQWLEQQQDLLFVNHELANLPAAYGARTGDLDGDGLTDIVVATMPQHHEHAFYALVWLRQIQRGRFVQHDVEISTAQHACLDLCDVDRDGRLDIVVGHFEGRDIAQAPWISIWWNDGQRTEKLGL